MNRENARFPLSKFLKSLLTWKGQLVGWCVFIVLVILGGVVFGGARQGGGLSGADGLGIQGLGFSQGDLREETMGEEPLVSPLPSNRQVVVLTDLFELQKKWEKEFENRISSLISKVVGVGRAVIKVNVTLNAKNRDTLEEVVDPDSVVLKGQTRSTEAPDKNPLVFHGLGERSDRGEESDLQKELVTINNELSRTTTKIREHAGGIERVSVAILVDGVVRPVEGGQVKWKSRPQKELDQLENLIKNAIGFTVDRGDSVKIESIRFQSGYLEGLGGERRFFLGRESFLFKWLLLGASLILFFILVIRPLMGGNSLRREKIEKLSSAVGESENVEEPREVPPEKAESELLRGKIIDFLDRDEEKTTDALHIWLMRKKEL